MKIHNLIALTVLFCLSACSALGMPEYVFKSYQFGDEIVSKEFSSGELSEREARMLLEKLGKPWDPTIKKFFVVRAPTQRTGGYVFRFELLGNTLNACLERPDPLAAVTMEINNPTALVLSRSATLVVTPTGNCKYR